MLMFLDVRMSVLGFVSLLLTEHLVLFDVEWTGN